ncbi:peptidase family C54-domain-containing protein [Trametes punicea]|nr:peptidase family C54-domain-containing protein [Trametes punicea]
MSSKPSRTSPSPSSPTNSNHSGSNHGSKLPKFLQKPSRDRSKSMVDPSASTSSSPSSSSSSPVVSETPKHKKPGRRGSIFRDASSRRQSQDVEPVDVPQNAEEPADETPVIVEPVNISRPRTRSERPASDNYSSVSYYSPGSSSRLSDLPTRLSGWFAHTFSSSSTDLTLPSLLSQRHLNASVSPKGKGSALLTAARHGKGHLDKAMRYLLDSDATPDKCPDPIWLLGVQHPGYEPSPPSSTDLSASPGRRNSSDSRRSPSSFRSSTSSSPVGPSSVPPDQSLSQSLPASSNPSKDPSKNWPPVFYADFTSRIWLTYRSQFFPIRDTTLAALDAELSNSPTGLPSSPPTKKWNWSLGGEKGWTTDAGWGCMLRTGQSLLANALLHLHLGRDWRRPPHPVYTADYATYVQIITWFLDNPSPFCPFSVHRMALVGKDLGKDVGQWFGPSTAAGAIKTLVHAFPEAGLGVAVAADGTLYESDVYAASRSALYSTRRHGHTRMEWGDRAVLVLIGIRLGIEGVNPVYYNTIKTLYTFPQSVGIAGGRPSSSYYFVGSQADNLFYLDPHHARPAIPLRPPPSNAWDRQNSPETYGSDRERERERTYRPSQHFRSPTSPFSSGRASGTTSGGSSFSYRSPTLSPSPLQQQFSTSSASTSQSESSQSHMHARWQSSSVLPDDSAEMDSRELGLGADLDPVQRHYVTAYSPAELKTFHCERVRKMPLSGLDPSMLLGFLCKDEGEWLDLKDRIAELFRTNKSIFSLANEPPQYPSDSDDMGLESISEPDIDMPDDDEFSLENSPSPLRENSSSPGGSVHGSGVGGSVKSEVDTEDDPIAPLTPSAGKASFDIDASAPERMKREASQQSSQSSLSFDDEDDEEWEDPAEFPTPQMSSDPEPVNVPVSPPEALRPEPVPTPIPPAIAQARSTSSTTSKGTTGSSEKTRRKSKKSSSKTPRPSSHHQEAQAQQVQYPFPAAYPGEEAEAELASPPQPPPPGQGKRVPQMRTAKARDGGRTQSGGVKGVLVDDADDF